ncbi:MAG TPA: hypothetical protein VK841_22775 [Polyangiaceae bacterium]|nr:hypothetical protein [Polyangiaceae bacterium]
MQRPWLRQLAELAQSASLAAMHRAPDPVQSPSLAQRPSQEPAVGTGGASACGMRAPAFVSAVALGGAAGRGPTGRALATADVCTGGLSEGNPVRTGGASEGDPPYGGGGPPEGGTVGASMAGAFAADAAPGGPLAEAAGPTFGRCHAAHAQYPPPTPILVTSTPSARTAAVAPPVSPAAAPTRADGRSVVATGMSVRRDGAGAVSTAFDEIASLVLESRDGISARGRGGWRGRRGRRANTRLATDSSTLICGVCLLTSSTR